MRIIVVADEGDDEVNQLDGELWSLRCILNTVAIGFNDPFRHEKLYPYIQQSSRILLWI